MVRKKSSASAAPAEAASAAHRFALPESLDSAAAVALAEALRGARGEPLTLEAAGVRRLGGLCAQVLLSAAASWRADGCALSVADPSPEFVEALRLLGLGPDSLNTGAQAS